MLFAFLNRRYRQGHIDIIVASGRLFFGYGLGNGNAGGVPVAIGAGSRSGGEESDGIGYAL